MQRVPTPRPSRRRQEKERLPMALQDLLGRQQDEKSWKSCNSRLKSVASICLWKNEMPRKSPKTASKALEAPDQGVDTSTEEKLPEAPKKRIGRPPKYTPELAHEICVRLSDGEPLRKICRDDHMPTWAAVYQWMDRDEDLSLAIARAREAGQDAMAERAYVEMYDEPERILTEGGGKIDPGYVQLVKARAEITLKMLAKWNPKRYGDRVQLAGDAENPLKVEADLTIFDALITNIETKRQTKSHG